MTVVQVISVVITVLLLLFGGYLLMRLLSKAVFKSYFEAKEEFLSRDKEEEDGKIRQNKG